ncbi:unnamed protein product [Bursaphelenchus okinawaensis]|uniref:HIG1 domain-containing protein n=1 Tax=Bursaphelenchus okinawaensis TaxID=465554 RepID=A0A811JV25_9BILA|nr:unnamed protein product [Bursaphelenchus okinawaensis]CAG9085012.1 unnamed protein product [Bursaphelenchus okinawaensis]
MTFSALVVKSFGIRTAWTKELTKEEEYRLSKVQDKKERYSGVPNIPSDIGFQASKQTSGKVQQGGMLSHFVSNPFVIVGVALTAAALMGMIKRSVAGDRAGTQKYMQYRIMAQFFTVTAMVGGVAYFGATYEQTSKRD